MVFTIVGTYLNLPASINAQRKPQTWAPPSAFSITLFLIVQTLGIMQQSNLLVFAIQPTKPSQTLLRSGLDFLTNLSLISPTLGRFHSLSYSWPSFSPLYYCSSSDFVEAAWLSLPLSCISLSSSLLASYAWKLQMIGLMCRVLTISRILSS